MVDKSNSEIRFFSAEPPDSTTAFQAEYIDSTIALRTSCAFSAEASPYIHEGIDPSAWDGISQIIADGKQVQFIAGDNAQAPDYILGADGMLSRNPAKPVISEGGTVLIQIHSNKGLEAAHKLAQQLKVASVQERIAYWRRANPGSSDIPEFLEGELSAAQNGGTTLPSAETNKPSTPLPDSPPRVDQPLPPMQPIARGGGGASGGDGGGISGGYRIGHSDIGRPPSSGYRDGNLDPNGPIDTSSIPKPVPGDLPIKGPPTCNVEQIQQFLDKMGSPAAREQGFSQALYDSCTQRGIDPSIALGFFLQESTCGRYGRGHENHSLGNIKGTAPESGLSDGTFRHYNSWAEGARDWARLIDESYVQKRGCESLSQVLAVYAPASDGNDVHGYAATVKGVVEHFKKANADSHVA